MRSRRLPALLALLAACVPWGILCGCTALPGMADPVVILEPRLNFLSLQGQARMDSPDPGGPVANPPVDVGDSFGLGRRKENMSGRAILGDRWSGFALEGQQQQFLQRRAILTGDFGNLVAPHEDRPVRTEVKGERYALSYHGVVLSAEALPGTTARFGVGASLEHQILRWRSFRWDQSQSQGIRSTQNWVPLARARLDVEYDVWGARADLGWSEGRFGDLDGRQLDLDLTARYRFQENVAVFGGWRRQDIPFRGREGNLPFELDLSMRAWLVGLSFTF